VLQRQNEVLAARGRELQAQTDLNKAIAEFQRATGNTLEANNVAVRSDTPMRELEMRRPGTIAGGGADILSIAPIFTDRGTASTSTTGVRANEK
jgi:hypothetical protein